MVKLLYLQVSAPPTDESYLYDNGTWTELDTDASHNHPFGMNDGGDIVGYNMGNHAFLYDNVTSTFTDLGALYDDRSVAFDINNVRAIVGVTGTDAASGERGFSYDKGRMD